MKLSPRERQARKSGCRTVDNPDAGPRTLHIRCGSDIQPALAEAGFAGDFLEYSNPLCQGPVTAGPDVLSERAAFLADAYGGDGAFGYDDALRKLQAEEDGLARAVSDYERVVLWFEHDSYDQLVLPRCLAAFAGSGRPRILELISVDRFPGVERFIGIGQLPPGSLRLLWTGRRPVTGAQLQLGARTWDALRSPDPSALADIMRSGAEALPHLRRALRRHLQELPSMRDGLSLTERLALEAVAEESRTIGEVFALLMREREPLPFLGDLMFLYVVESMRQAAEPPFAVTPETRAAHWPERRLLVTEAGRAVLAGRRDWLFLLPPERWVGGVRIRADELSWRWDDARGEPRIASR